MRVRVCEWGAAGRRRELADGVPFTSYVWNNCSCLLVVLILHTLHVCVSVCIYLCVSCLCPVCRPEVNANFYGQSCSPLQCLSGEVPPPFAANCLYEALYDSVDFLVERHLLRPEERVSGGGKEAQPQSISVSGAGWRERERESGEQEMEAEPAVLGRGVESAKKKNKKTNTWVLSKQLKRTRRRRGTRPRVRVRMRVAVRGVAAGAAAAAAARRGPARSAKGCRKAGDSSVQHSGHIT